MTSKLDCNDVLVSKGKFKTAKSTSVVLPRGQMSRLGYLSGLTHFEVLEEEPLLAELDELEVLDPLRVAGLVLLLEAGHDLEGVEELPDAGELVLDDGEEELLSYEDDGHLEEELHEAPAGAALFLPVA